MSDSHRNEITIGRIIGGLYLLQFVSGILVNVVLTAPLSGTPGFITNGAVYAHQIGISALVSFLIGISAIAIAVMAYPVFRVRSHSLALGFLALAIAGLAATIMEVIGTMSLVSFSKTFSQAGVAQQDLLESVKPVVASFRTWAHYSNILFSGVGLLVLYTMLYRFSLVPRVIGGFGLIAVSLQLGTIGATFLGQAVNFTLLAPLALSQVALIIWLLAKGFKPKS